MRYPGFIGPSYTLQSVNVDCQSSVNLFPEINQLGTGKEKEIASLVPTPGLSLLLTIPNTPIRGFWAASKGTLFVVAGSKLYSVSSAYSATELGTLSTDKGRVSIADNGDYVFIVDGSFGYHWRISTSTFTTVTDPNFYPADQVTFQDGYFIFNKKGTQQFFISGLNDVTFDPLDFGSAEGSPDNIIGLISNNQNLFLFGQRSLEIFYNTGDTDFPFSRIQGAVLDVGCSALFSVCRMLGNIYFLGGDTNGTGIVYEIQGFKHNRISTPAIESVIRGMTSDQVSASTAFTYQLGGHLFYCLNLYGTGSTWCYDASTGFWHERQYLGLWSTERHRAETCAVAYGKIIVGDYENGNLYSLNPDVYTDNGNPILRLRAAPHITDSLKYVTHHSFQLDMETGVGTDGINQGNDPTAVLQFSDDGGHSWSNEKYSKIGKIGKTKTRVIWRRLGSSRDRVYRVKITDPVKVVLIGAELEVEGGRS